MPRCETVRKRFVPVDGRNIAMTNLEKSASFKELERQYWNRRFLRESDDPAQLQRRYSSMATLGDPWGITSYLENVIAIAPPSSLILEVGAGVNSQAIGLALFREFSVVVSDLSVECLVANHHAVLGLNSTAAISYTAADGENLPFSDSSFDIVLVHATLHHVPTPRCAVAEMARCLRPGGLLVLGHEPNRLVFEPLRRMAGMLRITERYTQRFVDGSDSVADEQTPGFYGAELRRWLREFGLVIEWMTPVWYLNALLYNLPVVASLLFDKQLRFPVFLLRLARRADSVLARIPVIRELSLFWSVGARKST